MFKLLQNNFSKIIPESLYYLLFDTILKLISFGSIFVFTFLMNKNDYGEFGYYLTFISLFTIFMGLSTNRSIVALNHSNKIIGFIPNIFILNLISSISFLLILSLFRIDNITFEIWLIILIISIFSNFNSIILEILRNKGEILKYGLTNLSIALFNLLFSVLFILLFPQSTVVMRLSGLLAANVIITFINIKIFLPFHLNNFDHLLIFKIIRFSLPLIPFAISAFALNFVDRLFIEHYLGFSYLGEYTFAYNLGLIIFTLSMGLGKYSQNKIYLNIQKNGNIKEINNNNIYFFSLIFSIYLLFIKFFIQFLAPDYIASFPLIVITAYSYSFYHIFSLHEQLMLFFKKTIVIMLFTLVASLINAIFNFLFIPFFGLYAAVYSTLISYITLTILVYFYFLIKRISFPISFKYLIVFLLYTGIYSLIIVLL